MSEASYDSLLLESTLQALRQVGPLLDFHASEDEAVEIVARCEDSSLSLKWEKAAGVQRGEQKSWVGLPRPASGYGALRLIFDAPSERAARLANSTLERLRRRKGFEVVTSSLSANVEADEIWMALDPSRLVRLLASTHAIVHFADEWEEGTVLTAFASRAGIPVVSHAAASFSLASTTDIKVEEWSADAFVLAIESMLERPRHTPVVPDDIRAEVVAIC